MPLNAILCAVVVGGLCAPSASTCDDRFPASCASSYAAQEERVPYPRRKPRSAVQTPLHYPAPSSVGNEAVDRAGNHIGRASDLSIRINHGSLPTQTEAPQPGNIALQNRVHKALEDIFILQRQIFEIQLLARGDKLLTERLAFHNK